MPDLTVDDVEKFTRGRLSANDDVVQDILDAALVRARNYVGWHVSPVVTGGVLTLDGPSGVELWMPTRNIVAVGSVVENGVTLDPGAYVVPADNRQVIIRKTACWTREYAGIVVTLDHGFTEAQAADWRRAILLMVDRMSREQQSGERSDEDLIRKRVHDVEYQWVDWGAAADRAITSVESIIDHYTLVPSGFA